MMICSLKMWHDVLTKCGMDTCKFEILYSIPHNLLEMCSILHIGNVNTIYHKNY